MNIKSKSDTVVWALAIATLSLAAMFEVKSMMINLGATMHDIHCRDHDVRVN